MNDTANRMASPPESPAIPSLRLYSLALTNIGPFDHVELELCPEDITGPVPVTIITGENGAGKSILLDAIRGMFGQLYAQLERPIWRAGEPFEIRLRLGYDGRRLDTAAIETNGGNRLRSDVGELGNLPALVWQQNHAAPGWVVDFWRSTLATDSYDIGSLPAQNHRQFLMGSLQGTQSNADVTRLLVHFDYLRGSREPREQRAGEVLYQTARKIVERSLLDGELLDVARSTFTPMVRQGGQTVPLANLSSGNAYMIQRMIGMLGKMYAVNTLRGEEPEKMCETPGLLLLDEAENHLHPRWQKRFLPDVLELFPNLQIIATTHSPFVVGSVPGARVHVCRYDAASHSTTVEDVSQEYADLPVEEILSSEAFNGTEPFGEEVSELLETRRKAIEAGDQAARGVAEEQLYDRNPRYFSYLKLDERVRALRAQG